MCEHNFIVDGSHGVGACRCTVCNAKFPLGIMVQQLSGKITRLESLFESLMSKKVKKLEENEIKKK
jgi:hypothetical protein